VSPSVATVPQTPAGNAEQPLQAVEESAALLRACSALLEKNRDDAVEAAVAAGATWTQIGKALGVSAQAAHKKFRGHAADVPAGTAEQGIRESGSHRHRLPPWIHPDEHVMFRLGRLAQLAQRSTDSALTMPLGFGRTDLKVIRELSLSGALTGTELRRQCQVDKAGISRSVGSLRRRGIVERSCDDAGKAARYRLTAAGSRMVDRVMPLLAARQDDVLRGLPTDAVNIILDALTRNLKRMMENSH
jgi:DNA-binding MarR family transcriptional regulator